MYLRQQVPVPELGERQTRGFVFRCPARHQLPPAVLEMLRELFDDLVLAGRREAQRRQAGRTCRAQSRKFEWSGMYARSSQSHVANPRAARGWDQQGMPATQEASPPQ